MKRFFLVFFVLSFSLASFAQESVIGDMNGDNQLSASDVANLVDAIMLKKEKQYYYSADAFIKENSLTGTFKVNGIEKKYVDGVLDPYNGHEYVDLGLSVKWAKTNIDATAPTLSGTYCAWGETASKNTYDLPGYKYYDSSSRLFTKYCTDSEFGAIDAKCHLDATDDIASVKWGGNWRTPTPEEFHELIENCYIVKTSSYSGTGLAGIIVYKAKTEADRGGYSSTDVSTYTLDDTHIFLRFAGFKTVKYSYGSGSRAYYWTNTLNPLSPNEAINFYFSNGTFDISGITRNCGIPVRAVCP